MTAGTRARRAAHWVGPVLGTAGAFAAILVIYLIVLTRGVIL